jgi:UDP-N-acetylglucosamine 2-epimerase (non-hydrolysing)
MTIRILCVAGARPNFIKIAPLLRVFRSSARFEAGLVHTGQHYDDKLSRVFFDELHIPRPDVQMDVGPGSHAIQSAEIMRRFEPVLAQRQPHVVLVVGDVTSTIACALVAAKFHLNEPFECRYGKRTRPIIVHVEAGLRSFDDDMPEEINRRLTDCISDVLYVSEPSGVRNLEREGVPSEKIVMVGNVMIDTLLAARDRSRQSSILIDMGLVPREYGVVTLHRPSNVDDSVTLQNLLAILDEVAKEVPLVFPVHPRTRQRLAADGLDLSAPSWRIVDPIGYLDFTHLLSEAKFVLTDSGGVQEETTVLGVPCITLRENTERPVTVDAGTNQLVGTDPVKIRAAVQRARSDRVAGRVPEFWDGRAAERIAQHLDQLFTLNGGYE